MKISKTVGKNAFGQIIADVQLIQTALNLIKACNHKPYYQNKIDGKAGPKTILAIESFQCENKIKVTGKIEVSGPTINRLKQKAGDKVKSKINNEYHQPTMGRYSDLLEDKNRAVSMLNKFIKDVQEFEKVREKWWNNEIELDAKNEKTMTLLFNWFGTFTVEHTLKLKKKAKHMLEIASGATGWKFTPYYDLKGYGLPHAWTGVRYHHYKVGYKKLDVDRKSIQFFGKYSELDPKKRAAVFIHELVHASNGPAIKGNDGLGHFLKASSKTGFYSIKFEQSSVPDPRYLTEKQTILNADSWKAYFLND